MAKTLLNGVNDVLKRLNVIQEDLTSLTLSQKQRDIDVTVSVWNEAVQELYSMGVDSFPVERGSFTITLVAGTRSYGFGDTPVTDVAQLIWPAIDETNGHQIHWVEWERLRRIQLIPADFVGRPNFGTINPNDGNIYFDQIPTAAEAGEVYKFEYDKTLTLSAATDTMPFHDGVYFALVPVVAGAFNLETKTQPLNVLFQTHFARAAKLLRQTRPRQT